MAGRFTNQRYDPISYKHEVAQSTAPLSYKLDPNSVINCNNCYHPYGPRDSHDNAIAVGNKISVESILKGIGKKSEIKPSDRFPLTKLSTCKDNSLEPISSRYTHPAFDIKGLAPADMHLSFPLHDPQCQIFEPFQINTRLQAKDNHRAIWQTPIDQTKFLPKEKPRKRLNCKISCE